MLFSDKLHLPSEYCCQSKSVLSIANNIKSQYINQNKALVLLPEWSKGSESTHSNSGFTEAAADAIFASIVQLDQALGGEVGEHDASGNLVKLYDDKGDLIRTQGDIFNSSLHFIGFSRGTVVNSEIIQRLGTYFPFAGGEVNDDGTPVLKDGKRVRDLQMTTIDPHDFYQESLKVDLIIPRAIIIKDYRDFNEPQVQVWDNVTFADNYYQTVADPNGSTWTPNGRSIDGADVNKLLDGKLGFISDDQRGGPHGNVFSWYAGTADLGIDEVDNGYTQKPRPVYDQLADPALEDLFGPDDVTVTPWYFSNENRSSTEGITTGWFYSALGGGKDKRPIVDLSQRVSVGEDNTDEDVAKGDFAVPTLFNGNFDGITTKVDSQPIPGWSLHSGLGNTSIASIVNTQASLVDWRDIPSLSRPGIIDYDNEGIPIFDNQSYLQRLGIDPYAPNYQSNYALELEAGQSIIHNQFVVPEWGTLRFNLHVPDILNKPIDFDNQRLKVFLKGTGADTTEYELTSRVIFKGDNVNSPRDVTRLSGVEIDFGGSPFRPNYQDNQIAYGNVGFETFNLDVPDQLRGQSATLRFELEQGLYDVYLDDVFFQSQHLLFGNPTNAIKDFDPTLSEVENDAINNRHSSNYLIERPQYAISYNNVTKTPNWVSWELNNSWLGVLDRRDSFEEDKTLPVQWDKVKGNGDINGNPDINGERYDRGHLVASFDRRRTFKDQYSTYLMTNIVPQNDTNNEDPEWWRGLEGFTRNLVQNGRELYIIAGGRGQKSDIISQDGFLINVPESLWKVILVLDKPGQGIADITSNTMAFAIDIPNIDPEDDNIINPTSWKDYIISVQELENRLEGEPFNDYDFLSNISTEIQEIIENRSREKILEWINGVSPTAALLAAYETPIMSDPSSAIISSDTSIRHNSFVEDSAFASGNLKMARSSQVGITQVGIVERSFSQNSIPQVGMAEVSSFESSLTEYSTAQISTLQISSFQSSFTKTRSPQVGITQVSITEVTPVQTSVTEIGFSENNPSKILIGKTNFWQLHSSEIPFSSSISSEQVFSIHNNSSPLTNIFQDNPLNPWPTLFDPTFNINLQITDLPTGQLAEAQITNYDSFGRPNSGTILIDHDANGIGWFIDPTPNDNSEYTTTLTDTAYRATTGDAFGKYDLLTTILHETGHLLGIISGNPGFDKYIQTINSTKTFIADNINATLTSDGSHLDSKVHPYDLMNNTLSPGVRKLPSWLNLQMLNAIRTGDGEMRRWGDGGNTLQAPLTAILLADITNGNFNESDPTKPEFGWTTRGATTILNSHAVLTEDSPLLSNLTQTFIIPEKAKYLQFTILDTQLGTNTFAPNDAFEVALLDTQTLTPLIGTATGLIRWLQALDIPFLMTGKKRRNQKVFYTTQYLAISLQEKTFWFTVNRLLISTGKHGMIETDKEELSNKNH